MRVCDILESFDGKDEEPVSHEQHIEDLRRKTFACVRELRRICEKYKIKPFNYPEYMAVAHPEVHNRYVFLRARHKRLVGEIRALTKP